MKIAASLVIVLLLTPSFTSAQWKHAEAGLPQWDVLSAIDATDSLTAVASIAVNSPQTIGSITTRYPLARTIDGGATWTLRALPTAADNPVDIAMTDANHIWCGSSTGRIYASADGGATWTLQFSDTTKTTFINYIEMFNQNDGIAMGDNVTVLNKPVVFLSTSNGGVTWTPTLPVGSEGDWSGDVWRRLDFIDTKTGYFYGSKEGVPHKTTDGAATSTAVPFPRKDVLRVIKFYNESIGLASTQVNDRSLPPQMYRTKNGGAAWELINGGFDDSWGNDIEFVPGDPAKVWYSSYNGMYFSADTGRTWTRQAFDSANVHGRDIELVAGGCGWFGCDNRVIYRSSNATALYNVQTGVEGHPSVMPSTFRLEQNYPNPFNPSTTIVFALPGTDYVSLKVYSALGAEVATLVASELSPGVHTVNWDASAQASGMYFYQLRAGGAVETRRLLLLK